MSRCILALLVAMAAPATVHAQRIQPEIRLETISPSYNALVGVALHVPMGRYVRVGFGGTGFAIGRTDVIARFSFDPFRQMRWALSAGGGLSYDAGKETLFLALHGDIEGPRLGSVTPFVSAGLAGGARFALGLRRAFTNRR